MVVVVGGGGFGSVSVRRMRGGGRGQENGIGRIGERRE